ncbi:unnamed protein product [Brugia pahangi]|uniref:Secreted protein n=1 Tax=Brugia pahangi TaxID=6280 RepID=A0A0N4TMD5_BRUPA|nr:unnamed protein product [Brugia pahangi]
MVPTLRMNWLMNYDIPVRCWGLCYLVANVAPINYLRTNFRVMILLLQSCRTCSLELHITGIVIDRNPVGVRFILIFGPRNLDLSSPRN